MSAPRRRASDQGKAQRIVAGWVGIAMASAAGVFGLLRDNNAVVGFAFLGVLVAGNILPFDAVKTLLPWGRK